jgi:dihydrofolate synthase/folylpolyglutamate synthase
MDIEYYERHYMVNEIKGTRSFEGSIPLGGDYQKANLRTIFQVFSCFEGVLKISKENLVDGIRNVVKNTGLLGRWQILGRDPLIVCDTGHNYEGLEYVIKQLLMIPVVKRHFVVGFVSDKDLSSVLPLFPPDAEYYFTRASVPRAMNEMKLMIEASAYGLKGDCYSSVSEAYSYALSRSSKHDLIFIGGSTFVVAEVI